MQFDKFRIAALPFITDAYCQKDGAALKEVSDGFISKAMYCPKCEAVYTLKLVKVKVSKEFLKQAREDAKLK